MRTNVSDDLKIRLSTACGVVADETGERPHVATLHRWATNGLAGVKLRTVYAGGHKRTTKRWVREFFAAVTAAKSGEAESVEPSGRRREELRRVDSELDAAGI